MGVRIDYFSGILYTGFMDGSIIRKAIHKIKSNQVLVNFQVPSNYIILSIIIDWILYMMEFI